jgi:hypothetical protein
MLIRRYAGFAPCAHKTKAPAVIQQEPLVLQNQAYALMIPLRIAYLTNSDLECRFNFFMIFSR